MQLVRVLNRKNHSECTAIL